MKVIQRTNGILDLKVLQTLDTHSLLLAHFREIQSSAVIEDEHLSKPFLLRVGTDCIVDGFAYLKNNTLPYARIQQSIVFDFQWKDLSDGSANRFEGRNSMGSYIASLQKDNGIIARTITKYSPWSFVKGGIESIDISRTEIQLGGLWFSGATLTETLRGENVLTRRSASLMKIETSEGAFEGLPTDEQSYVWADLLPTDAPLDEAKPPSEKTLLTLAAARKHTLEYEVNGLIERVDKKMGIQAIWPPLSIFLEAKPEATAALVELLRARKIPRKATMSVYIGLGNTPTTEAKQALVGIMKDRSAPIFERSRAVLSLFGRDDVGIGLANYLSDSAQYIEKSDDLGRRMFARQTMLALGAMAGYQDDPEVKRIAVERIRNLLPTLEHHLHKRPVYGAIANIGDENLLDLVSDIRNENNSNIRQAAAVVVRRMDPTLTSSFTSEWLKVEDNWNVKREIYSIVERQGFDKNKNFSKELLGIAMNDLKSKPGIICRKALIRILARELTFAKAEKRKSRLGVEELFLSLIPFELKERSGLYKLLARSIDPDRLREVLSEPESEPTQEPVDIAITNPVDGSATHGGLQ